MQGAADRSERDHRHAVSLVHLQANLMRAKKIPSLNEILKNRPKATAADVRARLEVWKKTLPQRKWSEWLNQ
jgi:hypothetical protein